MGYSNEERELAKSEKQVVNARLCSEYFVTVAISDDPLHVDYVLEFEIVADKGIQTEEVIKHTLYK